MTSPVSAIEAIEKAPNRVQGMVRSIDQYRNGDPKAIADGSHAQVLYALTDYKHDVLVLWDFAVATARQAEALQRENAEKDAEIAKLRGMIRDNGTPRFNAVCDRAETAEREVAELRAVMKDCHSALKMLVSPGVIQGTTVIGAFAAATSAERRARALLGGYENAE